MSKIIAHASLSGRWENFQVTLDDVSYDSPEEVEFAIKAAFLSHLSKFVIIREPISIEDDDDE
jgi:hypothetical protein